MYTTVVPHTPFLSFIIHVLTFIFPYLFPHFHGTIHHVVPLFYFNWVCMCVCVRFYTGLFVRVFCRVFQC
ncbi:hypothetical protein AHF37_07606 [Paragonimus kellicotti]|nr:hypothetical protein AHF37_07606 [Paragonimus kellicotti]